MPIVRTDSKHYTNIADKIREKTGSTDSIYSEQMADGVGEVYEAGAKSVMEHIQDNCERYSYKYAFCGYGWDGTTFNPTRDIILKNGDTYVFGYTYMLPLKKQLEKNNVKLDTSQMTNMDYLFWYSFIKPNKDHIIPPIGNDNVTSAGSCFYVATGLYVIEKFTVSPTCSGLNNAFFRCDALESVTFGNKIGVSGVTFNHSTRLTHECLLHIIDMLEDKSADTSGTVWKLNLGSTNLAKLTEDEKNIAYTKGWYLA